MSCGGIQALADKGYLQVAVRNAGYIDASFTVTVRSCWPGACPRMPAVVASLLVEHSA